MRALHIASLLLTVSLLAGCVDESDNVSWYVVSNPSAGFGPVQGGLVVTWRHSFKSVGVIRASGGDNAGAGEPLLLFVEESGGPNGTDPNAERDLFLGIDNDLVVISTLNDTTIHSPALPGGELRVQGPGNLALAPDPATAVRLSSADGTTYHVPVSGNLVAAERASGVTVWRPGLVDQLFPAGSELTTQGTDFVVRETSGRRTLLFVPPGAAIGSQARVDGDALRFVAYDQSVSARLPNASFTRLNGADGTILTGDFPDGTGSGLTDPFRAVLPRRNHHLLLIRRASR